MIYYLVLRYCNEKNKILPIYISVSREGAYDFIKNADEERLHCCYSIAEVQGEVFMYKLSGEEKEKKEEPEKNLDDAIDGMLKIAKEYLDNAAKHISEKINNEEKTIKNPIYIICKPNKRYELSTSDRCVCVTEPEEHDAFECLDDAANFILEKIAEKHISEFNNAFRCYEKLKEKSNNET